MQPAANQQPESPALRMLTHMFQEFFIARIVGSQEYHGFYATYTTSDGLMYMGQGENVKRAVLDCRQHIEDCQPSLKPYQRAIKTNPKDRKAHLGNIAAGYVVTDLSTGRTEKPIALLDNDYLILEQEGKAAYVVPQWPQPDPKPVLKYHAPEPETDEVCQYCGGSPEDCHPRRVDVDVFGCDNTLGRRA